VKRSLFGLAALLFAACQNHPPSIPIVNGTSRCRPGDTARFTAISVDADDDSLSYEFGWGDGAGSDWSAAIAPGVGYPVEHVFTDSGLFGVLARSRDRKVESGWSDTFWVRVREYTPFVPPQPSGPESLAVSDSATFFTTASHPLTERVSVEFSWGDSTSTWTAFGGSGSVFRSRHSYALPGTYQVMARARDSSEYLSGWSEPLALLVLDSLR